MVQVVTEAGSSGKCGDSDLITEPVWRHCGRHPLPHPPSSRRGETQSSKWPKAKQVSPQLPWGYVTAEEKGSKTEKLRPRPPSTPTTTRTGLGANRTGKSEAVERHVQMPTSCLRGPQAFLWRTVWKNFLLYPKGQDLWRVERWILWGLNHIVV